MKNSENMERGRRVVLKGMLEYACEKNVSRSADYDAFYSFVKDKLQVEINKNQLQDKVNKL